MMTKPAVVFNLTAEEIAFLERPVNGGGGHQRYHRELLAKVKAGDPFDDAELGKLMRHMGYGSGGYQARVRSAFKRVVTEKFHL